MIYVIGISYSVEYAIKGLYENTIGRITEWIRGETRTPQDEYARAVLQDYAAFLYTVPWYKYPFGEKLSGLLAISAPTPSRLRTSSATSRSAPNTSSRSATPALIQKGLDATSDDEARDIMFVVATLPAEVLAKEPRIKPIRALNAAMAAGADAALQGVHRNPASLLDRGIAVAEIAGNREILITVVAPKDAKLDVTDTTELFSLELDARPGFRRAGLRARVGRLVAIGRDLKARGATIEHFYDY